VGEDSNPQGVQKGKEAKLATCRGLQREKKTKKEIDEESFNSRGGEAGHEANHLF